MDVATLKTLCRELSRDFDRDETGPGVAQLLAAYAAAARDWRTHAFHRPGCYTRNLVFKDGMYELLLLCWGAGQSSPVHNHMDQNCWMAVLEGRMEEVQFACPDGPPCGPLVRRCSLSFDPGQVAYISDEIGIHLVRPIAGPGVSLHLYSRPYDTCKVYDLTTGVESIKTLTYDSIDGERCDEPVHSSSVPLC